jgi:nitroreductase
MQFKSVVGSRRSIRFFDPWRPVEREKLQTILEAVHRAPRLLDADLVRGVVVYRDKLSPEQLKGLKTPTTTAQLDMAPVIIFFFADLSALERVAEGANLRQLVSQGVLNKSHGWTEEFIQGPAASYIRGILDHPDRVPLRMRAEGSPTVSLEALRIARSAIGVAQCFAMLTAVNQGLGALLSALAAERLLKVPETWVGAASPLFLGYPGESPEAGGQRPREPFEEDFYELRYGHPFYREPAVVERLKALEMIQEPAPFPWRFDELQGLARKYGLPE